MAEQRKTMYELLGVPTDADEQTIRAAHQRTTEQLQSQHGSLGQDDVAARQKVLDWALQTLANPKLRADYDLKYLPRTPTEPEKTVPLAAIPPIVLEAGSERTAKSPLTRILTVIAGLMAAGLALQLMFVFLIPYRNAASLPGETTRIEGATSEIEEKVILQEYYQEHGIRAGSRTEAELLTNQARQKAEEERAAQREKERQEREYRRFLDEARRVGNEATANRERAEAMERAEAERMRRMQGQGWPVRESQDTGR